MLHETLGPEWLTPDLFRFGASSLLNDVLMQIRKEKHGPLPEPGLLHDRLMAEVEKTQDRSPVPSAWEYAPAPESRDIVRLEERYGLFIGGEWVEPRSGEYAPTHRPRDEEPLAEVA